MKKIYYRYELWEDHKNGMYFDGDPSDNTAIEMAANILKNNDLFYEIAKEMVNLWEHSAEMNLTNKNRNRQAWIGQASCSYRLGTPENITKLAWHTLTDKEKEEANKIADRVIHIYLLRYKEKKCQNKNLELMF